MIGYDSSSPEELAKLQLERLAGIASDLISDMACIKIALTHPIEEMEQSAAIKPDADCYETVGQVRAMRRQQSDLMLACRRAADFLAPYLDGHDDLRRRVHDDLVAALGGPQERPEPRNERYPLGKCPECKSLYVVRLSDRCRRCARCPHEWTLERRGKSARQVNEPKETR